jgi:hypothetical protein
MTNPYRAICAELVDALDAGIPAGRIRMSPLADRARALLAEPVAEGPTDEELREMLNENDWNYISPETFEDIARTVLAQWGRPAAAPVPEPGERPRELQWPASVAQGCHEAAAEAESGSPLQQLLVAAGDLLERVRARAALAEGEVGCISIDEMCEILRSLEIKAAEYTDCTILYELTFEQLRAICDTRAFALLAQRHPAPPAEGEVEELVNMLTGIAYWKRHGKPGKDDPSPFDIRQADRLTRAATLLQQQAAPVPVVAPVPVSERLPGPEDCDAEGRCWWGEPQIEDSYDATWNLCTQDDAEEWCTWGTKCGWLPANALPLPAPEETK